MCVFFLSTWVKIATSSESHTHNIRTMNCDCERSFVDLVSSDLFACARSRCITNVYKAIK